MTTYKAITKTLSEIYYDYDKVGYIERIGDMYSIEVYYMDLNLHVSQKRLIKGVVERLIKHKRQREYRQLVKRYEYRNSKLYGKKYVEFQIID